MRAQLLAFLLLSASITLAQVQSEQVVHRGETISVTSPGLTTGDKVSLKLTPIVATACPAGADAQQSGSTVNPVNLVPSPVGIEGPAPAAVSVGIPPDACFGLYQISGLQQKPAKTGEQPATPGPLEVTSPQYLRIVETPPAVTALSPAALFADDAANSSAGGSVPTYYLTFLGPTSLKANADYSLRFAGHALRPCTSGGSSQASAGASPPAGNTVSAGGATPADKQQPCFSQNKASSQDGAIAFSLRGARFLPDFDGKQSVSLVHNGAESTPQPLTVVNASRSTPRNFAIAITAGLIVLIYVLLSAGHRALFSKSGRSSLLTALFLDEETQSYSLSKCQFYAWTFAAILGYLFFAVARSIIQGSAAFPDIPSGLPGILLASAGTSVLATGITSTKGSKGAGIIHPTLADFITTGGVVAPERLQFVVWTVVGIFTFLTIVFKSDPLTLSDLPTIPDGFLQLMGISSAGYLAGKLARKAGPVIRMVSVTSVKPLDYDQSGETAVEPTLVLNVKGQNLDPKATIKVDGQPLRSQLFSINPGSQPDPQTGFSTELNITLCSAAALIAGAHFVSLVNSDGQAADASFPLDTMTIDAITPQPGADKVTGTNFVADTKYRWYDATGKPIGNLQVATFVSDKELSVTPPAGAVSGSEYTLGLVSPLGLRAMKKIKL